MNSVLADKFVYGSDYPAISPKIWIDQFAQYIEGGFSWGGRTKYFREDSLEKFFRTNAVAAMNLDKLRPELVSAGKFEMLEKAGA